MVARPRSPEGKRVTIAAKFSESEAAEIEMARGDVLPGVWLREAALSVARGKGLSPAAAEVSARRSAARRAEPSLRKKPDAVVDAAIRGQDEKPIVPLIRDEPAGCPPHPKRRVLKGFCSQCKRGVLPGEKVA